MRRINAKKKRKHTTKTKYRYTCICKCKDSAMSKYIPIVRTTKRASLRNKVFFVMYGYTTVSYKKIKNFMILHAK